MGIPLEIFAVGIGSFLGGCARYLVSSCLTNGELLGRIPLGTLAVNVVGSLVIGLAAARIDLPPLNAPLFRPFFLTGVLGGFTTFSAFSYETVRMAQSDGLFIAGANVALNLALCLAAVWVGLKI